MSSQSDDYQPRQPRGNYAKLICLNCRARKIKCNLPNDVQVEPSPIPQPHEQSCVRCQQQGLDCIVDKTVLGRPSQKRRRPEHLNTASHHGVGGDASQEAELDPNVQDFVLSDLREEVLEIGDQITTSARTRPSKREVFESLMDSTHLFSALVSSDTQFGSLALKPALGSLVDVTKLVDKPLAMLMDEHLVWHRLHSPYIPTLAELHRDLLIEPDIRPTSPTRALFAILGLIALDVPSRRLRVPDTMWQQLQSLANSDCQRLLLDLPVHRHALFVFELVDWYKPLVLASAHSIAAISIKGNLSRTLGKRTAQKLEFDHAAGRLERLMRSSEVIESTIVRVRVLETLQWCRWLMLESIVDGYMMKSNIEQRGILPEVKGLLAIVKRAVESFPMPPSVLLMYHHLSSASIEMQAAAATKQHWLDLTSLAKLIETHDQKCQDYTRYLDRLLASCDRSNNPRADEEIEAIKRIRTTDLNASHVRISGLSMFYALMSGLRPSGTETNTREITPDEAVQVSSEVISNLKTKHNTLSDPKSVASFITKHGDPRFARLEQVLKDFVSTADALSLGGIPWTPPSVPTVSLLLQTCREIVENNSTRLKGWGGMHPNVDVHIILLQDVAKRLDGMDGLGGGPDAIARGSIYAAGAKLVRSLCGIVSEWRKKIIEQELKDATAEGAKVSMPAEFDGMEAFLSGDLLDDWNEWPQAEDLDFSELLADGLEWVDWAQLTPPSENISLG